MKMNEQHHSGSDATRRMARLRARTRSAPLQTNYREPCLTITSRPTFVC